MTKPVFEVEFTAVPVPAKRLGWVDLAGPWSIPLNREFNRYEITHMPEATYVEEPQ